ncbi:MAG: transposase [Acidobacteriota bacterium]
MYAYRWQIELFFKYLKRTLNCLHMLNHSQNGVEIQFYVLMTLAILFLNFKQDCQNSAEKKPTAEEIEAKKQASPSEWIRKISKVLYESWKISKNWLLIVKNSIAEVIDKKLLTMLNSS